MGGISCDAEESTFPVCPDGEECFCIDVDESCDDGDDDWGYIGEGWIFYCSYDGTFYAEMMGGINCADSDLGFVGEDDGEGHHRGKLVVGRLHLGNLRGLPYTRQSSIQASALVLPIWHPS